MSKLFSLESESSQSESGNDLLIDKLLEKEKEEQSPLSLTADLLKRRDEITKDIKEHVENTEKEQEESGENTDSDEESNEPDDEGSNDDSSDKDSNDDDEKVDKDDDEESEGLEADDEDSLASLVGSELEGGKKGKVDHKKNDKDEVSTESFGFSATLSNTFNPLRSTYSQYVTALESFDKNLTPTKETEQPIVYVKEAVLESIKNLTTVAYNYTDSNKTFVDKTSEAILKLSERVTVFTQLVEAGKFQFTHKLISDRDILSNISFTGHSDIRETIRVLLKYLNNSNKSSALLLNSEFDELKSAFLTQEFAEDHTDLVYNKPVPGFNLIKVSLVPYTNYLKTKIENFHYYKLKVMKTEDLYTLPGISVTEDADIKYIVENLNELMVSLSVSVDSLKGVSDHFENFTDSLKVIAYNVQNDEYKNLSELGLDNKVKDFIRFKLVMEICFININLVLDYMTSVISALNIALELKE